MPLKVTNANIGYDHQVVVKDLNFSIQKGDFIALIGPNGAGKSTLLKSLIGVLPIIDGKINWADFNADNPFRITGFSPQTQIIDWFTTAFDNILQGPLLAGFSFHESKEFAKQAANLLDIDNLLDKPVDHLSGGQQQRIQIAREIARQPHIYILDEPTTGLDVESSEKLFQYLKERSDNGNLVIASSHDLTLLDEYVDKVLFIDHNQQIFFGSLKEFTANASLRETYLKERDKHES